MTLTEGPGELTLKMHRALLCFELRLTIAITSYFSLGWEVRIDPLFVLLSGPHLLTHMHSRSSQWTVC